MCRSSVSRPPSSTTRLWSIDNRQCSNTGRIACGLHSDVPGVSPMFCSSGYWYDHPEIAPSRLVSLPALAHQQRTELHVYSQERR